MSIKRTLTLAAVGLLSAVALSGCVSSGPGYYPPAPIYGVGLVGAPGYGYGYGYRHRPRVFGGRAYGRRYGGFRRGYRGPRHFGRGGRRHFGGWR